ncbi:MAG: hypothetical protein HC923_00745 [Myxococcales bacterium]|nr:hypothetical protein [Myxococcales bacterium]
MRNWRLLQDLHKFPPIPMAFEDSADLIEVDEDRTAIHEVSPIEPAELAPRSAALICISGRSIGQMFLTHQGRDDARASPGV